MYIVLELDKSIADTSKREKYIAKEPKNWEAYLSPANVMQDTVIPGVRRALEFFQLLKYPIVILTNRGEELRDVTMRWLLEELNLTVPDEFLIMRPQGNLLNPSEYKREQLLNFRSGLEDRDAGFLIVDSDPDAWNSLETFGIVVRAPEFWSVVFPIPGIRPADENWGS